MQSRKHTAWKKNRKLGDVMGGRTFPKLADKVFNREHCLSAPVEMEETPIFLIDNPSRDFYFPISEQEIKSIFAMLPVDATAHITHIWLHKMKKQEYLDGLTNLASCITGSGVILIILYPFPFDNKMRLGKKKPLRKVLNEFKDYTTELHQDKDGWFLQWTENQARKYMAENLLLNEIADSLESIKKSYLSKTHQTNRNYNLQYLKSFITGNDY